MSSSSTSPMQPLEPTNTVINTGGTTGSNEEDRKPSAESTMTEAVTDAHQLPSKDETPPLSALLAAGHSEAVASAPGAATTTTAATAVARLPESSVDDNNNNSSALDSKAPPGGHAFDQMESVDLPKFVKDHKGTLTFPEKLMLMLMHIERYYTKQGWALEKAPIAWTSNGRAFVIRDNDKLVSDWLPVFFQKGKFSSFKRKLYRWGFRQVQLLNHDLSTIGNRELVFGNENFQRDQKVLLPRMKSITAESLRRQQAAVLKEQRKEAVAMEGENPQAALKQEHQVLNGLVAQNQQNEVLHTLTALLSPIGLPPPAPPRPLQQQQEAGPTPNELASVLSTMNPGVAPNSQKALDLFTAALMLQQHGANTMQEQQQPTRASQHTFGDVSSLLQGTNNAATLQQILLNLQEQQRRQQQEEMIKNIHRMMFPSQQQPAALDSSTSGQQSVLARLILQQLGSLGANGH